jgi:hypothetical protein
MQRQFPHTKVVVHQMLGMENAQELYFRLWTPMNYQLSLLASLSTLAYDQQARL